MQKIRTLFFVFCFIAFSFWASAATFQSDQVIPRVIELIKENYIDQARVDPLKMLKAASSETANGVAEILVTFDQHSFSVTIGQAVKRFPIPSEASLTWLGSTLADFMTFVEIHYHGEMKLKDIEYLAIDGMLSTLDPHSNLLTPKVFSEFKVGTEGKFGGVGIVISVKEGELTVIAPIDGTPAAAAGIKAGDKIIQIDDESTVNMSITEAVERLRGQIGAEVSLTIERPGRAQTFSVTIKRALIEIESVQSTLIKKDGDNIGYIKVKNFQEDTGKAFNKALKSLEAAGNLKGLVLDLRNNPGGLLQQSVEISDRFLLSGVIVSTVGAKGRLLEREVARPENEPKYPVVILVNEGSASASEIVAGALKSYKNSIIVGSQTFGKGSVQTVYDLRDGSALKLTIAEYLTRGEESIQSIGITPDIILIPNVADKNEINLVKDEVQQERTLAGHFEEVSQAARPIYELGYLETFKEEKEGEEYKQGLDLANDFAVNLAGDIITNADGKGLAEVAREAVKRAEEIERPKVFEALKRQGIDWSSCEASQGRPILEVSFFIKKGGKQVREIEAGDEVELVLKGRNIGSAPFCKLIGVSSSNDTRLKNMEFAFGKIPPGSEKAAARQFKAHENLVSQLIPMTIDFEEGGGNIPSQFQVLLPIKGLPRPQFAFSYELVPPPDTKAGPPLPKGKTIPLIVKVKNIGEGAAHKPLVTIKSLDEEGGVYIERGRVKLEGLNPGEIRNAELRFHVIPRFQGAKFTLEIAIVDVELFEVISQKVEFSVPSGAGAPQAGLWYQGPIIKLKQLPTYTTNLVQRIEGKIVDDGQVKDYFISVGGDKVVYEAVPVSTGEFSFAAGLKLEQGNNVISIVARDTDNLMTRRAVVIERR